MSRNLNLGRKDFRINWNTASQLAAASHRGSDFHRLSSGHDRTAVSSGSPRQKKQYRDILLTYNVPFLCLFCVIPVPPWRRPWVFPSTTEFASQSCWIFCTSTEASPFNQLPPQFERCMPAKWNSVGFQQAFVRNCGALLSKDRAEPASPMN